MRLLIALAALLVATSAQAHLIILEGTFAPEAAGATGSGTLRLEYDNDGHTLLINAAWEGLSGTTNNAHIHCCTTAPFTGTVGVALATDGILPDFPLGVDNGTYDRVIDLTQTTSYSATFVTASGGTAAAAETRLINNLISGNAYFNIHSTTFPPGEIRTFLTVVPEPATWGMMLAGLVAIVGMAARRRRT